MALHGGMSSVVRRMKVLNATVHGFRSTFRDYIGEETQLEQLIKMESSMEFGSCTAIVVN